MLHAERVIYIDILRRQCLIYTTKHHIQNISYSYLGVNACWSNLMLDLDETFTGLLSSRDEFMRPVFTDLPRRPFSVNEVATEESNIYLYNWRMCNREDEMLFHLI